MMYVTYDKDHIHC